MREQLELLEALNISNVHAAIADRIIAHAYAAEDLDEQLAEVFDLLAIRAGELASECRAGATADALVDRVTKFDRLRVTAILGYGVKITNEISEDVSE